MYYFSQNITIMVTSIVEPLGFSGSQPVVTSAEEGGYVFGAVCLSVCLSVRRITSKLVNGF